MEVTDYSSFPHKSHTIRYQILFAVFYTSVFSFFCQPFSTSILEQNQALTPLNALEFLIVHNQLISFRYIQTHTSYTPSLAEWRKHSNHFLCVCGSDEKPQVRKAGRIITKISCFFGITFAYSLMVNLTFYSPFSKNFNGCSLFRALILIYLFMIGFHGFSESGTNLLILPYPLLALPWTLIVNLNKFNVSGLSFSST